MKNYQKSDYALNKRSSGIVYRSGEQVYTITLEAYLVENPGKSEVDFQKLKALSDAMYLEQDRADYNQTRKNIPFQAFESSVALGSDSLEDTYFERLDKLWAAQAFSSLLESGELTETQERRITLHICGGLSTREIAAQEGVAQRAIVKSIHAATEKLRTFFTF